MIRDGGVSARGLRGHGSSPLFVSSLGLLHYYECGGVSSPTSSLRSVNVNVMAKWPLSSFRRPGRRTADRGRRIEEDQRSSFSILVFVTLYDKIEAMRSANTHLKDAQGALEWCYLSLNILAYLTLAVLRVSLDTRAPLPLNYKDSWRTHLDRQILGRARKTLKLGCRWK